MKKGVPMEKRGAELSLNFIILAILGVIVLIGIVFFFLGGAEFFAKKEKGITVLSEQDLKVSEAACKLYCSLENWEKWDNPGFPEKVVQYAESKGFKPNCEDLMSRDKINPDDKRVWTVDCVKPKEPVAQ